MMSSLQLLLVEDNELDARSIRRFLTQIFGDQHRVTHCPTLKDGLAAAAEMAFDCVLLDLSLPDSEGLLIVETFFENYPDMPLVVLTGLDDPEVAIEAVERGAQDYVPKHQIDVDLLSRSISYAITRHRAEVRLREAHEQLELLEDRERIARDLHDTVIQRLFATGMALQAMASKLDQVELREDLLDSVDSIDSAIKELRDAIFGMRSVRAQPPLEASVRQTLADRASSLGHQPRLTIDGSLADVSEAVQHALIPTLNEALSNVAKHASASATEIHIEVGPKLRLSVTDNGVGLRSRSDAQAEQAGDGLGNLLHRAAELGGACYVGPGPGGGTRLVWEAIN